MCTEEHSSECKKSTRLRFWSKLFHTFHLAIWDLSIYHFLLSQNTSALVTSHIRSFHGYSLVSPMHTWISIFTRPIICGDHSRTRNILFNLNRIQDWIQRIEETTTWDHCLFISNQLLIIDGEYLHRLSEWQSRFHFCASFSDVHIKQEQMWIMLRRMHLITIKFTETILVWWTIYSCPQETVPVKGWQRSQLIEKAASGECLRLLQRQIVLKRPEYS